MLINFNTGYVRKTGELDLNPAMIKDEPSLWNSSLETAYRFGGPITKKVIDNLNLDGGYKHIVVDVKTHLLQKGMIPAIPGWHTDGVPRHPNMSPAMGGDPLLSLQLGARSPKYHLLVLGADSMTRFIKNRDLTLDVTSDASLYKGLSSTINEMDAAGMLSTYDIEPATIYEWDWWEIHTAQRAKSSGWRYLIRVTETDYYAPQTDLNEILRKQQQVFVPEEFGW